MRPLPPRERKEASFSLRTFELDDAHALYEAINASVVHLKPWITWGDAHTSVEVTYDEIRSIRAQWMLDSNFVIGIFSPNGKRVLGGTGFHPRDGALGLDTTEIGMWIRAEEAGRGLGTKVLATMVDWAFRDWWWKRLEWRCDAENQRSIAVAEKCNFLLDGRLRSHTRDISGVRRDTLIYSKIADDMPSKPVTKC